MHRITLPVLALGLGMAAPAHAECGWPQVVQLNVTAATVRPGKAPIHFVQVDALRAGCPNASAACQAKAYVMPGDTVITANREGAFTCAAFVNARGVATIAFLPYAALTPASAAPPNAFAGRWIAPEQNLDIDPASAGAFHVSGSATWGMGDRWRVEHGGIHTGEVEGVAKPVGGVIAFTQGDGATLPFDKGDEYDCRLRLVRRGPYLVARDNNNCGGANVSFSGIYVRKAAKRRG